MTRSRRFLALLLLVVTNPMGAELQLAPREREAFEYLRRTDTFAQPYVGIAGEYSGEYLALRILGRSAGADAAFKELVRSAATAGRLYGLIGLYRTDPAAFRKAVASFTNSKEMVPSFVGCIRMPERVAGIVQSEHAIVVGPGETLEEAWKRPDAQSALDIAHGGYTAMFFGPAVRGEDDARRAEDAYDFKPRP